MRYYILDDDLASRKILSRIISDEFLGEIVGEADQALEAEMDIIKSQPDIVLIDLLMPDQDGIETVQNLKKRNFQGKFIMISQIENKEMVAKAYQEGIDYFIHKPINRVEVASVIRKVMEQMKMERSLFKIKESLAHLQPAENESFRPQITNNHTILQNILGDLGILGESGSNDLIEIMDYIYQSKQYHSFFSENQSLKDIYLGVFQIKQKSVTEKDLKAMEQRVRRTVNQAMTNLASLGLTDYAHPKFEYYATKFFDFNEIRLKMRELDKDNAVRAARINLRKFLHALYAEMNSKLE